VSGDILPFREQVRDVVMVVSSSRSGSSFLMELLSHASGTIQLQGEINPLLRLARLDPWSTGAGSDALDSGHCNPAALRVLDAEMAREAGTRIPQFDNPTLDVPRLALDVWRRLALQWPAESIPLDLVEVSVTETLHELQVAHGWRPEEFRDGQMFVALLLRRLCREFPRLQPHYYDLSPGLVASVFPGLDAPDGPPSDTIMEEPPFIGVTPWRPCRTEDLRTRPLIIKSPSNAYRLAFFRAVFPQARFRILHLTRNPAASINGLIDGWLFRGFYAHRMPRPLEIAGYSDVRPGDAWWWKFDLPPGWEAWTRRSLQEVCAFQWWSAHDAILEFAERHVVPYHRMRFEDLIGLPELRDDRLRALCRWLGVDAGAELQAALAGGVRPIMGTRAPRLRRWTARSEELRTVLDTEPVQRVSHALSYHDEAEWI
jgi:hypothetical protein